MSGFYCLNTIKFKDVDNPITKGLEKNKVLEIKIPSYPYVSEIFIQRGESLAPSSELYEYVEGKKGNKIEKELDIISYNEYGKGKCIWFGFYVDIGALDRDPICLQLARNICELVKK